ncbi:hypothetical protein WKT02_08805 [Erysipelotrichaceae bacterium HCN-30851]
MTQEELSKDLQISKDNLLKVRKAIVAIGCLHTATDWMEEMKATADYGGEKVEINVMDTIDEIVKEYIQLKMGTKDEINIKIKEKEE